MVKELEEKGFEKSVFEADSPVVVDFWAKWCGPCLKMDPVIESLSEQFKGKIKFFRLNVDEEASLTFEFGVRGIPTLFLFKNREVIDRITGTIGRKDLECRLRKLL